MYYGQFIKSLTGKSDVKTSIRSFGHVLEMTNEGVVRINGEATDLKSLEEARDYIKTKIYSCKLKEQVTNELYEEISETRIANIIKEHHNIKVTDTLIESYIDLASSKIFTVDPVVCEIRKINKLDVVIENKLHYELNDGSVVAIDYATQESLNKLLQNHKDVVEYMRESANNFLYVVEQIKE